MPSPRAPVVPRRLPLIEAPVAGLPRGSRTPIRGRDLTPNDSKLTTEPCQNNRTARQNVTLNSPGVTKPIGPRHFPGVSDRFGRRRVRTPIAARWMRRAEPILHHNRSGCQGQQRAYRTSLTTTKGNGIHRGCVLTRTGWGPVQTTVRIAGEGWPRASPDTRDADVHHFHTPTPD